MTEPTCGNCRWWHRDEWGDGYCCNSDSEHCTECREPSHSCDNHEAKDKSDE